VRAQSDLRPGRGSSPLLCYVTDRRALAAEPSLSTLIHKIREIAVSGVDWIQIREKDLPPKELAALAQEALPVSGTSPASLRVLINDRVDVAIALRAGGVHLGHRSLPIVEAKRIIADAKRNRVVAEDFLAGVSCHSLEEARVAERGGADYIFFGPTFATPSKEEFGAPQGVERLAEVCRAITVPVWAIGGITVETTGACRAAGAAGIAAIRLFQDAADPRAIVDSIRHASRA